MGERLTLTPTGYRRIAYVALGALTLIVLTGAAVRLTGSGLGCPDWPKCFGKAIPPLQTHAVIEYGNRIITGFVSLAAAAAAIGAFRRRPFRRDLAILGPLLLAGVVAQAVLGGLTVEGYLDFGFVMGHFALSMLILVVGVTLAWRATHEPSREAPAGDRVTVWAVRALVPLGALTIFIGTAATAAGPHAGGEPGQRIHRLAFDGKGTLNQVIHYHGTIAALLGVATVAVWLLARRRAGGSGDAVRRPLTVLALLLAAQGVVGGVQYALKLPSEIVWVHVGLAALTWLSILWAAAAAGRPAPREARAETREGLRLDAAAMR